MDAKILRPQAGPQEQYLSSPADIAIYGGAAGGGKTWALLLEPLRHIHNKEFGAVIFRRTYPQITMEGGMWDESANVYPFLGASQNQAELYWKFPSGARVSFAHLQYEKTKLNWDGAQIALLGFDQLEHFSESTFFYMMQRNRSTCGVRPYIRATCNPDPESFLARFLAWWIDQETGYPIPERSGVLRWFVRVNEIIEWSDSAEELRTRFPIPNILPKSVTFVPAKVEDNRILMECDPGYLANLLAQPYVERERKHGGNWKVKPAAGKVFNRAWFEIVDAVPAGGDECRGWDFAATEKTLDKDDPDFTASVKIRKVKGTYYVIDCTAEQLSPMDAERDFENTTRQDARAARAQDIRYLVRWEQEPGAAGKRESFRLTRLLAGIDALGVTSRGDKITRAKGLAAQAQAGNVKLLKGAWNEMFLAHLHNQPDWPHDDIMDAAEKSFTPLTNYGVGVDESHTDDMQKNRWAVKPIGQTETDDDTNPIKWNLG